MGSINKSEYLSKIQRFCLMDDTFMSKVFEDKQCAELLLKIVLKKDLTVINSVSQCSVKNLQGRSIRLDIYAVDDAGVHYNIEVQRSNDGAVPKRARYNSSLIDANISETGEDYDSLPETYVIFITERDVLKGGLPLYTINRKIEEMNNKPFDDDSHIIYINSEIRDNTELGRLMQDFFCTDAKNMNYGVLAQRVNYFKNDEKGVGTMCEIMNEVKNEGRDEGRKESQIETALNMIAKGKYELEEISEISGLTLEEVEELAEKKSV